MKPILPIRPLLLLVVVLTVSAHDSGESFEEIFEEYPSIADDLFPDLLEEASEVDISVDRDAVVNLLRRYFNEGGERRKRDLSLSGGINREFHSGGHTTSGSGTLTKAFSDKHSVSGSVGGSRTTIPGLGSFDSLATGGTYSYKPRQDTSVSLTGSKAFNPGGSSTSSLTGSLTRNVGQDSSLTGSITANKHNLPGGPSVSSHSAGVSYNYRPNKDTVISAGLETSRGPGGSTDNRGGFSFSHFFGG